MTNHDHDELRIAVLGDLHGHFRLALTLLKRWETEHGQTLDAILQVGDFGVWPAPYKLDPQTARFARRDPDEISFPEYEQMTPESSKFFDGQDSVHSIVASIIFVKGNHEDFEHLESLERYHGQGTIPVDYFQRFHYLPNGRTTRIHARGHVVTVGGLGGIERDHGTRDQDVAALRTTPVDILLTHEPYRGGVDVWKGSLKSLRLIHAIQPSFVFCGHYHIAGQELERVNHTKGYILNEVNFRVRHRLNPGCFGILNWTSPQDASFSFVEDAWLHDYTRDNYKDTPVRK